MYLGDLPNWFVLCFGVILGLLFGSFLNVVIHRLPRGQNIAYPPSTCPACGAHIAPYDNIPVISWLLLRGKARCCGTRINARYPAVEMLGGLLAAAILHLLVLPLGDTTPVAVALGWFALYLTLSLALLAALFIDLEFMILPDTLTLGGAALGLFSLPFRDIDVTDAVVGGLLGYGLVWGVFHHGYRLLRGQAGMGLGDAKLLLLTGVWFGWQGVLFALAAGSVQGTLIAIVVFMAQGKLEEPEAVAQEREELQRTLETLDEEARRQVLAELEDDLLAHPPSEGLAGARIAFGPFLILATLEFMLFSDRLAALYYDWFLVT